MKHLYQKLVHYLSKVIFGKNEVTQAQWKQLALTFQVFGGFIFTSLGIPAYLGTDYAIAVYWFLLSIVFVWIGFRLNNNVKDDD